MGHTNGEVACHLLQPISVLQTTLSYLRYDVMVRFSVMPLAKQELMNDIIFS